MVNEEAVLKEWEGYELPEMKKRETHLEKLMDTDHIIDIQGPRRVGKTSMKNLSSQKVDEWRRKHFI